MIEVGKNFSKTHNLIIKTFLNIERMAHLSKLYYKISEW